MIFVIFVLQGSKTKIETDMNNFFSKCTDLVFTHVKEFHILSCVHVHLSGSDEIQFSIYCDGNFQANKYAGEEESMYSPRYSGVEYKLGKDEEENYEGLVVGILEYKPEKKKRQLFLLINRFRLVGGTDFTKRYLPQRLVQYHKVGQQVTTDVVHIDMVRAPLFLVPALDKDMDIADIGRDSANKQMFYVISQGKVWCTSIMKYVDYFHKNNTLFSNCLQKRTTKNLNFNPFLSIDDMIYIKEYLNVQRNIKPFNSDVLEDFDFNFEYDDENAMFTEN